MESMNLKTVGGVAVGVGVSSLLLKSRSPLVLMAFGIGGGIISNYLFKNRGEKISEAEKKAQKMMQGVREDIENTFEGDSDGTSNEDQSEASGRKNIHFDERIGYMRPMGDISDGSPADFVDVEF